MTSDERGERIRSRFEEARQWFRDHHAGVEPDAGFAERIVARLERHRAEDLALAALRLLPATIALVMVLTWFVGSRGRESPVATAASVGDDLIAWVFGETEPTP